MKTRITELFGIKHPVMLAGMNCITDPKLVAAVCNAGGLGILATADLTADEARRDIQEIRRLTNKPFGINQALRVPLAEEKVKVAMDEKVPIINYSLGKPWFIEQVHGYGGKVVGTVAVAKHASRAEKMGVDAIVVTGHEAAAHGGDATSLVLIPIVASRVKVPLIAAGGFYDGRGLVAALALGADGISMGTRFMISKESKVHDNYKQLCLRATEQDTLYSDRFDGMPSRVLKTKVTEGMMKRRFPVGSMLSGTIALKKKLNMSQGDFTRLVFSMLRGEDKTNLLAQARFAGSWLRLTKAVRDGDEKQGLLCVGQDCGGINDIPSCQEIVESIVAEAEGILKAACQKYF